MDRLISGAERLGLTLSPEQVEQFEVYYRELIDWNRRVNLTAITGYEDVQVNHFLDSLTVVTSWQPVSDARPLIIDVGSGAGLPGIPLRIVFPNLRLTLLEATGKKAAFLHHLREIINMPDIEVVIGRAEEIAHDPGYGEAFDLVLSRAVAALPTLAELTLPFCALNGSVILHKKGDIEAEIDQASSAITTLGGRLREVKDVSLPKFEDERRLVVIDKVSATPEQYPRRPGIPKKRPL
jgi:16S rRNA (guanine527-N7)-methyltransferase